ncbi:unnamed protein product [Acanthoscelides obtectus]|uniref:Amino acid transporter transmembrane domain-containing protein n=1 Tax=Acanthoscelides obtectus TaxID=200917 RepID=A0A9P0JZR5_ACAOB|nr:unnamed protein product [Acanthoscelides obtectus]CAK1633766.1 Putative sodium-coupled neutral amino acid transporter 10 [Acanthoscelides obtectus]
MDNLNGHVMTLANSIIGVSILAMPYCFKQCGIILSILMLLVSSVISRLSCHFLLKSAIIARRKTFEFLAFHIFGCAGKFAIEIGIIGFLLGTCIAFFVVMGELGPQIVVEMTSIPTTSTMRTSILMALALFVVLPLGMLRNVDSLYGVSKATIAFYCCLVLNVVFEAVPHILTGDWYQNVSFWRPEGLMQCLPIFSMALFCQTQLFEMYQAIGLVGSTISIMICLLFPITCFICISQKNTNERLVAQLMLFVGIFIMVLGTYENLYTVDTVEVNKIGSTSPVDSIHHASVVKKKFLPLVTILVAEKPVTMKKIEVKTEIPLKITEKTRVKEIRHEPPQPVEPSEEEVKIKNEVKLTTQLIVQNDTKLEQVDIEAIKKEDKEEQAAKQDIKGDPNKALLDTIQKQNEVQKELVENQKKILEVIQSQQKKDESRNVEKLNEEKVKAVKQIQDIAQKAIEKISGGEKSIAAKETDRLKIIENTSEVKQGGEKINEFQQKVTPNLLEEVKMSNVPEKIPEKSPNKPILNEVNSQEQAKQIQKVMEVIKKHNIDVNQIVKYTKSVEKSNDMQYKVKGTVNVTKQIIEENIKLTEKIDSKTTKSSNISAKQSPLPVQLDSFGNHISKNNTAPLFMNLGKKLENEGGSKQIPIP